MCVRVGVDQLLELQFLTLDVISFALRFLVVFLSPSRLTVRQIYNHVNYNPSAVLSNKTSAAGMA